MYASSLRLVIYSISPSTAGKVKFHLVTQMARGEMLRRGEEKQCLSQMCSAPGSVKVLQPCYLTQVQVEIQLHCCV